MERRYLLQIFIHSRHVLMKLSRHVSEGPFFYIKYSEQKCALLNSVVMMISQCFCETIFILTMNEWQCIYRPKLQQRTKRRQRQYIVGLTVTRADGLT